MMQKRLYYGLFQGDGRLLKVAAKRAIPSGNRALSPQNEERISKQVYDEFRLWQKEQNEEKGRDYER